MKRILERIKTDYIEQASLAIISLLAGLLLSKLVDDYLDYFTILLVLTLAFLFIYYKHSQRVEDIAKVLTHCYGRCLGEIVYYDDPETFYEAGAEYVLEAKKEILIFNDYFGQNEVVMGYNTPEQYFRKLESTVENNSKDPAFKMSCIVAAEKITSAKLAGKYEEHLSRLFEISDRREKNQIQPFNHADARILYVSFTIVDGSVLRLAIEGIHRSNDGPSSKVVGGFIIKDNTEIIERFRSLYYHTLRQSVVFKDLNSIKQAIGD
ncbi:MAG: hypothetical protein D3906_02985 [Candidatus Electrothrix sp. AUS1_2]|nr:hypothetical protein [Candidatus Electrothrix sp. AUS1_2]